MVEDMDIRVLEIRELYQLFVAEMKEETRNSNAYRKARFGVYIHFDIYDYFAGVLDIKYKVGRVLYRGRAFKATDLWTEIEERKRVIIKWLNENTPDDLVGARGLGDKND